MMRRIYGSLLCLSLSLCAHGQTLRQCQEAAAKNYPLIKQYGLIRETTGISVDNIAKGWLPQIAATAQATWQSDVTAWPEGMQTMLKQMGVGVKGLKKDQYRVGIDVQQTVFDGGAISSQREIALRQGAVEQAQAEVNLYQVRRRVNEMYFALLLIDEQIALNDDLQALLSASEKKLSAMLNRGTAAESDYKTVKAERLNVLQQGTSLRSQKAALAAMLSAFCGLKVENVQKPQPLRVAETVKRPELNAIDAQLQLTQAHENALDAALKPRLSLFAQGYYGYPGLNMFDDMMNHRWSLNGIVGARITWNIGALYTRKNDKARLQLQRQMAEANREVFLFNNRIEQIQQQERINCYGRLMDGDDEIIALRSSVRKAAESKLAHGIIDVNDLVKEINAENNARVQHSIHEIQMLKEIYDLKFIVNDTASPAEELKS